MITTKLQRCRLLNHRTSSPMRSPTMVPSATSPSVASPVSLIATLGLQPQWTDAPLGAGQSRQVLRTGLSNASSATPQRRPQRKSSVWFASVPLDSIGDGGCCKMVMHRTTTTLGLRGNGPAQAHRPSLPHQAPRRSHLSRCCPSHPSTLNPSLRIFLNRLQNNQHPNQMLPPSRRLVPGFWRPMV